MARQDYAMSLPGQALVKTLRRDHGIEPTLDEIVWIHELGKELMCPGGSAPSSALGLPVTIGNISLWPHTFGASMWWQIACEWFDGEDEDMQVWLLVFSLMYARDADMIRSCNNYDSTLKKVLELKLNAFVTMEELSWALGQILPQQSESQSTAPKSSSENYTNILSAVCTEFGGDLEHWRWGEDIDCVVDMLVHAQAQSAMKQGLKISGPQHKAQSDLHAAKVEIINRHKQKIEK